MIKFNIYNQSIFIEDRIDDIVTEFSNSIESNKPVEFSIVDPYFDYDKLYQSYDENFNDTSNDLWLCLLNELTLYFQIVKITILSAKPNKRNPMLNEQLFGRNSNDFVKFNYHNSEFYCYYYRNPKKENRAPNKPQLHDRWLLWKNKDNSKNAVHIGVSLSDIYNKDITISNITKENVESYFTRYDELLRLSNV